MTVGVQEPCGGVDTGRLAGSGSLAGGVSQDTVLLLKGAMTRGWGQGLRHIVVTVQRFSQEAPSPQARPEHDYAQ